MQTDSRIVTSNQPGVHEDLEKVLKRYKQRKYMRPISDFSKATFLEIQAWIEKRGVKQLILDMGCGVGESSYLLGQKYPDYSIIGIDKSLSRLNRSNQFKESLPENVLLIRGELLDQWYLFNQASRNRDFEIIKQYILYPNPWPKKKHLKRRWHGNPVFPIIMQMNTDIELRTNWKIYAEEFELACYEFGFSKIEFSTIKPADFLTPFEKKYSQSAQKIYQVLIKKKEA